MPIPPILHLPLHRATLRPRYRRCNSNHRCCGDACDLVQQLVVSLECVVYVVCAGIWRSSHLAAGLRRIRGDLLGIDLNEYREPR